VASRPRNIENYLRGWTVYDLSGLIVLEAACGVRDYQLNFWDAQIWAAARLNQLPVVFSEDFNIGATLEGVRFVNPFATTFQLADWV
jgi:predicted nucleic acid-binding protein